MLRNDKKIEGCVINRSCTATSQLIFGQFSIEKIGRKRKKERKKERQKKWNRKK